MNRSETLELYTGRGSPSGKQWVAWMMEIGLLPGVYLVHSSTSNDMGSEQHKRREPRASTMPPPQGTLDSETDLSSFCPSRQAHGATYSPQFLARSFASTNSYDSAVPSSTPGMPNLSGPVRAACVAGGE